MNASETAIANAAAEYDAAEAAVRSALAVRDFAGDAYQLACRLHNEALKASSAATRNYFITMRDVARIEEAVAAL
jgi:hypothetical protein